MIRLQIARVYAEALVEVAGEHGILEEIADNARAFMDLFRAEPGIKAFFDAPDISAEAGKEIIEKAFKGRINGYFVNMLFVLADKRRLTLLPRICGVILELRDKAAGVIHARATTAVELDAAAVERIKASIEKKTVKEVVIETRVDKSLIGGMTLVIGEERVDGSLAHGLDKLKQEILERFSHEIQS